MPINHAQEVFLLPPKSGTFHSFHLLSLFSSSDSPRNLNTIIEGREREREKRWKRERERRGGREREREEVEEREREKRWKRERERDSHTKYKQTKLL